MPQSARRYLLYLYVVLPALLLAGAAIYYLCPSLRLPANADALRRLPPVQAVDAHRYDQEWFDAARAGRLDILGALHEAHYPIDSQTHAGFTALILAAYDDQPAAVDYLLRAGADACIADHNGNTALMGALYKGEPDIARRLLKAGCAIDQANNAGETALSFAALFGRLDIIPELVALGADPDHADARGRTALQTAYAQGNPQAAEALRRAGASR